MPDQLPPSAKTRLDQLLIERGLFPSRSRARDAIKRGTVVCDGIVADKAGLPVNQNAVVSINDPASGYVSRSALKLVHGLDRFGLDPRGRLCLDIGASTGGFTQVLLERGAGKVIAIDAGREQLHPDIAADERVVNHENTNARSIGPELFADGGPQFVVCDVSFISLKLALPPALSLAAPGAEGVFLVKPQFEVGKAAIGKNGIVRDSALAQKAVSDMATWLSDEQGWQVLGVEPSPISGGDGNREFLLAGRKPE